MIQQIFPFSSLLALSGFVLAVSGCGGGASSNAMVTQAEPVVFQDAAAQCLVTDIADDIAELLFTEIDRQWTCEIASADGMRFDDIYFSRTGFASLGSDNAWFWNRRLDDDAINLLSPTFGSLVLRQIESANTTLTFTSTSDMGVRESYDCVMVAREVENPRL